MVINIYLQNIKKKYRKNYSLRNDIKYIYNSIIFCKISFEYFD